MNVPKKYRLYYCDFIKCKSLGKCLIPMSGEDCCTLGLVSEEDVIKYREWLETNRREMGT